MTLLSSVLLWLACGLVMLLAILLIARMRPTGHWGPFGRWLGLGVIAFAVALSDADVPLPLSALVLILAVMLWRNRRRLAWQLAHAPLTRWPRPPETKGPTS